MRSLVLLSLLAACGPRPATCPPTPVVAAAPKLASARALPCPVSVLRAAPPAVVTYRDLAAASQALTRDSVAPDRDDLIADNRDHGPAFGFGVMFRAYAGSTRVTHQHAVFVQPRSVVVVERLADVASFIPPRCGSPAPDEVLAARIVAAPGIPHLGHLRFRRHGVSDAATLPDVPAPPARDPACPPESETFRIEDSFIDLDRGEHLMTLAQVYRGPFTQPEPSGALPVDAFTFDDTGVVIPETTAACDHTFAWPWPQHE